MFTLLIKLFMAWPLSAFPTSALIIHWFVFILQQNKNVYNALHTECYFYFQGFAHAFCLNEASFMLSPSHPLIPRSLPCVVWVTELCTSLLIMFVHISSLFSILYCNCLFRCLIAPLDCEVPISGCGLLVFDPSGCSPVPGTCNWQSQK